MDFPNNLLTGAQAPITHQPDCMAQYDPLIPCNCNESVSIETLLAEQEEFNLDSNMLNHPLFQHANDELLSKFINVLNALSSAKETVPEILEDIQKYIHETIFGKKTLEELKEEFQSLGLAQRWTCQKPIKENEICFRCLDCETDNHPNFYYVICAECFEKSSHEGHRLVMLKHPATVEISCNCGSPEAFKPEGFCPDHKYVDVNMKDILAKFPEEMVKNFIETMNKVFYGTICLMELVYYLKEKPGFKPMKMLFQLITIQTASFFESLTSQIGSSLLAIVDSVLRDSFRSPFNKLWHDCNDFSGEQKGPADPTQHRECSCTILGSLFKCGKYLENQDQIIISKIVAQSLDDIPFREFFALEFSKYTRFYFPQMFMENSVIIKGNAKILEYNNMIWCMEDLLELVIKNKYLNQYMSVLQTIVETYTSLTEGIVETLSFLADVWSFYFNPDNAKTAPLVRKEILESTVTSEFLQHMMTFQMKFFYPDRIGIEMQFEEIDYGFINSSQVMSLCMTYGLNYALKLIEVLPKEEKTPLLKRLMGDWHEFYQTVNLVLVDNTYFQSLTPLLERALYSIIRCYTSDFTKENVEEFFRECLPEVNIEELARPIISRLMKVLGLMRYINIVHHKQTGPFIEGYYQLDFTIFETDMSLVHLMGMFVKPQDLLTLLTENYFSFDEKFQEEQEDFGGSLLRAFNSQDNQYKKERTMMVEDFLSFLVFIMNDDTSQLNLNMNDKYNRKSTKNPDLEKVLEKVTVNFLLTQYWTDIAYFNDLLFGLVFGEDSMDPIILKLTIKDEKTHRIRIKEGYEKEVDPYVFFKNAIVLRDLQTELNNRYRNSETVDLVSGKFYEDLLPQVRTFQKSIYQGLLPQILSKIVSQKTLSKEVLSFIRIVLKLILLNLQSIDDSLNINASETEIEEMKKRIQESYLNEAFSVGLVRLKKLPAFKDCIRCITKITDLIKSLSSEFNQEGLPEAMAGLTKQESVREDKKKAAMERMNKLKEEFAKKQSQFTDKNKDLVAGAGEESKTASPDVQEKRGKTCQHCLDTIDEDNQFYGVPIHVSFTNNFYQVDQTENPFNEENYENFHNAKWWPVLSSCHHYYHTKCIISNLKSVNQAHLLYQNFYSNPFENHCSLCKTLYNSFLVLNQENNTAKAAYEAETPDPVEIALGRSIVPVQVNKIFTILKTTLSQKEQSLLYEQVDILVIFTRAFDYFMESFQFCQDSKTTEKTLALYISFFKTLGPYFGGDASKYAQYGISFLEFLGSDTKYGYFDYQTDIWLSTLSFVNTLKVVETSLNEREVIEKQLLVSGTKILTEYIQFKTVQLMACLDENRPTDLAGCFKLLQNNPEMKKEILEKFAYPIQKILLGSFVSKWIASDKGLPTSSSFYKIISKPNKELTTEALDDFMKLIGFEEDLSTVFDKAVSELSIAPIQAHLAILLKVLQSDDPKEKKSIRVRKLAPRMIKLPETYAEYNAKYFKRKCCLCNKYSNHMFTYICLICDEVFCQGFCPPHRNKVGNMNSHCRKYHFGKSVFLDMFQPMVNIINHPINGIQPVVNMYTDPMGVPIQQALGRHLDLLTLDFKKFTLNPALVEEIERMVLNQNIDNECFRMLINYPPEDQIPPHNEL